MKAKAGYSKNIPAIEQWIKKKPVDHFSRRVITPDALSEPVKKLLLRALQSEERISWMIDVPPQGIYHPQRAGSWFRKFWQIWELTPGTLVALTDHRLLLITNTSVDIDPQITSILLDNILCLEHGIVLLFSWLNIHWHENDILREETLYFDSVDEAIFLPLIRSLRRSTASRDISALYERTEPPTDPGGWDDEKQLVDPCNRNALQKLPLKFLNMIPHYGLLHDEHISQVLYRPAQWRTLLGLTRVMTAPQMVVLHTDAYLLVAAEDLSWTNGSYGLTLIFLPCRFVQSVFTSRNGKQCSLNIHLETQRTARDWSFPFPLQMEEAVSAFARHLHGEQDRQVGRTGKSGM